MKKENKAAHTKGPWGIMQTQTGLYIYRANKKGERSAIALLKLSWARADDRQRSDAYLLAAAPDLLAAIKHLLFVFPANHSKKDNKKSAQLAAAVMAAVKAVKKAEGGKP